MFQKLQLARHLATENSVLATTQTKASFDKKGSALFFCIE
jgi:hypothetical protein